MKIKPEELVNLPEDIALRLLKYHDCTYRITNRDGTIYIITHDYNPDRYNLTITDKIITKVHFG